MPSWLIFLFGMVAGVVLGGVVVIGGILASFARNGSWLK